MTVTVEQTKQDIDEVERRYKERMGIENFEPTLENLRKSDPHIDFEHYGVNDEHLTNLAISNYGFQGILFVTGVHLGLMLAEVVAERQADAQRASDAA